MRAEDFDEFAQLVDEAYDLLGKTEKSKAISGGAKSMFFRALEKYPLPVVRAAISAHCTDATHGQFPPTPADIIRQIEFATNSDGRPGAEEAWATALRSQDERDTVVWTQETAEAFAIARPVLDSSGAISARKTFIEAYSRLIGEARSARVPATWVASLGWDKDRQVQVLKKAQVAGLLPRAQVLALLPPPPAEAATDDDKARAQLAKIKQLLADSEAEKQRRLDEAFDREVADDNAWRQELNQRVNEYVGGKA